MSTQRIVVGVDGSECSQQALEWALDEATLRGAQVDVVCAWAPPVMAYAAVPVVMPYDPTELEGAARTTVDTMVAETGRRDVNVEKIVALGSAASTLLDVAKGADLLVVGSRGRGGFSGLLLGSVSQAVSHHAPCPVVIVREA